MKKNTRFKDMLIIGFALFAMFFGSGNLIFPPYLGRLVGEEYWIGLIGFMIMGVGLPLLGVMATAKMGGDFGTVASKVGNTFSIILTTALILTIGPLFAIPRTAATTFEIGIQPFFEGIEPMVFIGIYFLVNMLFVMTSTSIIDVIGKFLTPVLLVTLLVLIAKGVMSPVGGVTQTALDNVFSSSLVEGYQTMDALAAVCFGGIIVGSIKSKGYKEPNDIIKMTLKSSLVAIIGLGIIYGGLMYLGTHTAHISGTIEKTTLVTVLAEQILGQVGSVFLAIAVSLACMTTSIGLTATGAGYFSKLTKGKLSYNVVAALISLISMAIALMGVDKIIGLTLPVLKILYPIIIVLVVLAFLQKWLPSQKAYQGVVYVTLVVAVVDVLSVSLNIAPLVKIINYIPLSQYGFAWVVPAVLTLLGYKYILK